MSRITTTTKIIYNFLRDFIDFQHLLVIFKL